MNMKVSFLALMLLGSLLALSTYAQAQSYRTAVGLRLGAPTAVSLKRYVGEQSAFEIQVGSRRLFDVRLFTISPSFQLHQSLNLSQPVLSDMKWYWGLGGSILFVNVDGGFSSNPFYSVDAYVGLEYTFDDIPLSLTVDWVPRVFLGELRPANFGLGYGALGVRYLLN